MTILRLPWPDKRLHPHAKGHCRPKHEATKAARFYAKVVADEARVEPDPKARLVFMFSPPKRGGTPDIQNMPHRCKAYIDGIADAMGVDDRHFRVAWPAEFLNKCDGGSVTVRIETTGVTTTT